MPIKTTFPSQKVMANKSKATAAEIEDQYEKGDFRLTQERNDFFLPQIRDFVKTEKWINLRPEYQRRLVWDQKKKSLLIESLLMNVPIPPVFLYEYDLNRYEVMDGQQRLNTILEFYEGDFSLKGLEEWSVLNGLTYNKCPPRIQRGLDRRRISATVLLAENSKLGGRNDIRREVFERLNTGGQSLNAQELRNSLYSGAFNDLIIRLAGNRLFDQIWEIPPYEDHKRPGFTSQELSENKLFKRMQDCELVLRFFAFRRISKLKGSVKSILDSCMEEFSQAKPEVLSALEQRFTKALELSEGIFSPHTFRAKDTKDHWRLSQPLFDAIMVAVDSQILHTSKLLASKNKIKTDLASELKNEDSYAIIVGRPNTSQAIKDRISLMQKILQNYI